MATLRNSTKGMARRLPIMGPVLRNRHGLRSVFTEPLLSAALDVLSGKPAFIPSNAPEIEAKDEDLREAVTAWIARGNSPGAQETEGFKRTVDEHLGIRTKYFSAYIVPWIQQAFDLTGKDVIEVGCGTGSSTAAFAQHVRAMYCYEIDQSSADIAELRFELAGLTNVKLYREVFTGGNSLSADLVLLAAPRTHDDRGADFNSLGELGSASTRRGIGSV